MKNGLIISLSLLLVYACGESKKETPKDSGEPKMPNIIYILADDLGYGDLGIFGQEKIQTPRLDQMAKEGIRFTHHYAGNTVCAPSRASLMTGLHQGHAPVRGNNNNVLVPEDFTLAEMFQNAGYSTALMGKWGLGEVGSTGEPTAQGFDTYFGYLNQIHAHNYYPDHLLKNGKKIPLTNQIIYAQEGYAKGIGSAATHKNEYSHTLIMEEALKFLEAPKTTPFFLYLPLTIPHANNEGELTADHGMEVPDLGIYASMDWPAPEKAKAAMISLLDADVGRLLDQLGELDLDKNTLVIFTSDNGPHMEGGVDPEFFKSNGLLRGTKRDLYEGGIRVPLIARWPGKIAPNTVSDLPSAFWDMLPTFADIIDQPLEQATDGISFLPTLLGVPYMQKYHEYLYWEFSEGNRDAQALRCGKWKLIYKFHSDTWELYDLHMDAGEERNLAPENPTIIENLKVFLEEAHVFDPDFPLEGEAILDTDP